MPDLFDSENTIAAILKAWRGRATFTSLDAFARGTGLSPSTVEKWETGTIGAAKSLRDVISAHRKIGTITRDEAEDLWEAVAEYRKAKYPRQIFPAFDWREGSPSDHAVIGGHSFPDAGSETFKIGGLAIGIVILAEAHYIPGRIRCRYDDRPLALPADLARLKQEFEADIARRKAQGELGLPHNGPGYKLIAFDITDRDTSTGEEIPLLDLHFAPTDYFTQCVTDLNLDNPVRNRYAEGVDLTLGPVPEFSGCLGINVTLVTKDGYVLLIRRSDRTGIFPGTYHTSVAENFLRPTDAGIDGAPDPFRCASRAAWEEVGLSVPPEKIEFTHFGAWLPTCQHSLIGWSRLPMTRSEVEERYRAMVPKDKWEGRVFYLPFTPEAIARFVVPDWDRWAGVGLAAVILALLRQGYSVANVADAIIRARHNEERRS